MHPASGSCFRLTRNRTGKVHSTSEAPHSHAVQTWGVGSQPKACSIFSERLWATRLVSGTHLGSWATSSNTRRAAWPGGAGSMVPTSAGRSRVCPMEELAGSRCPGAQERMCRAPSSLGAARDIIARQHERPTGPLPAHQPFAAPATLWLLSHLFGWSALQRPLPSPLSSDTSSAAQRVPGPISSLTSRCWLCWRPGGFPTAAGQHGSRRLGGSSRAS